MPLSIVGIGGQKCTFEGAGSWRVEQLKVAIYRRLGVPVEEQQLVHETKELRPGDVVDVTDAASTSVTLLRWRDAAGRSACEQDAETLRQSFQEGAYDPQAKNHLSQTLVFYSVQNPTWSAEVTKLLVEEYDVDLNHVDYDKQTAAHYLAKTSNVDCLHYYAEKQGNLNHRDRNGQTPIFFAASRGCPEMILALWEHGADVAARDAHGKTAFSWARNLDNFQALLICHFRLNKNLLAWTACSDGPVFAVLPAGETDVTSLSLLEEEFVSDHQRLLADILPDASKKDICEAVGLNPAPVDRKNIIRRISAARSPVQWTLKCVRAHGFGSGRRHQQVVGYCYCYQKENMGSFAVSHLKVSRKQQRRGVATLLLVGVVARLARLAKQGYIPANFGPENDGRRLLLSVVEQNMPARRLYHKLGFEDVAEPSGSPVSWVKMARKCDETAEELMESWLSYIPGECALAMEPGEGRSVVIHQAPKPAPKATGRPKGKPTKVHGAAAAKVLAAAARATSPAALPPPAAPRRGKAKAPAASAKAMTPSKRRRLL